MSLHYDRSATTVDDMATARISEEVEAARIAVVDAFESGKLGFLGCPDIDPSPFEGWAGALIDSKQFDAQVVIGVGGSSLGARAVLASSTEPLEGLETYFSENMDPITFGRLFDQLNLERTLFVVVTKSGSTIETMSKFWFAWKRVGEVVGGQRHKHFVAITDPVRGTLRAMANEHGLTTFEVPANVGGRFSVLTAVGLVPLALAGYPIRELLRGARAVRDRAVTPIEQGNPLLGAAADHALLQAEGVTQTVMMAYSDLLGPLVEWFCQLWGESLAKARNRAGEEIEIGLTPIKAIGVVDQHSQLQLYAEGPRDKHIVFVEVRDFGRDTLVPDGLPDALSHLNGKSLSTILDAELRGTRAALTQAGRANSTWRFDKISPENVGGFILAWEFITAIVGELWDINAFDQPGVELGKKIAHGLLGREGFEEFATLAAGEREEALALF